KNEMPASTFSDRLPIPSSGLLAPGSSQSATSPFEIAPRSLTLKPCQTRQDPGSQKGRPSPATMLPATASTPSLPYPLRSSVRPRKAAPSAVHTLRAQKYTCCMYKKAAKLQNNLICQVTATPALNTGPRTSYFAPAATVPYQTAPPCIVGR